MKKIIYLVLFSVIISSCSTAYYFRKSDYDRVVTKTVKKLKKSPEKIKQIEWLEKAYTIANKLDQERIDFLKLENDDRSWDEIYQIYGKLKWRQDKIREIIPLHYTGGVLDFPIIDYDEEMIEAKKNAAEYFYKHGQDLLESGDKYNARLAYNDFLKVKEYYPDYENVDQLIEEARIQGIAHVFVRLENNSYIDLPQAILMDMMPVSFHQLNTHWVHYYDENSEIYPDVELTIHINRVNISPGMINEKEYTEKKEISSWQYILDEEGNVMKDSLGNDMKEEVFEEISCNVFETIQRKEIVFEMTLKYVELLTDKELKSFPFFAESFFENRYATAAGDLNALSEETLSIIGLKPVPLPDDGTMIETAIPIIREAIGEAMRKNKKVVQ